MFKLLGSIVDTAVKTVAITATVTLAPVKFIAENTNEFVTDINKEVKDIFGGK